METPRLTLSDVTDNTDFRGAVNADTCKGNKFGIQGTDTVGFSPQITQKSPPEPNTLKPNPMETDPTPKQTFQPHDSPHPHFMSSNIPANDLFTVPILYSMDNQETKKGHVTQIVPKVKPHPRAWEKGSASNFPLKVTTWKRTPHTQCKEKKKTKSLTHLPGLVLRELNRIISTNMVLTQRRRRTSGIRVWPMKLNQLSQRRRLPLNPAEHHDHH